MSEATIRPNACIAVRSATPADVPTIFNLIRALAAYEKLLDAVTGNTGLLEQHLFGNSPYIQTIVAEVDGTPAGFALFFPNYLTISAQPGFYLEDLFVLPEYRGQGVGRALLRHLARLAVERQFSQLEWSVLDWNQPAIAFYHRIGAELMENIRICRVTGEALQQLAQGKPLFLRRATSADTQALATLVRANADYHQMLPEFSNHPETLKVHLFGGTPYAEAIVAEQDSQIVGFALFFHNYSTFLTQPGLYIEDLFVLPNYRRQGLGKALLHYLAQEAIARNCGRLEWFVQAWNTDAIIFYRRMGAVVLDDWRICRLNQMAIDALANS